MPRYKNFVDVWGEHEKHCADLLGFWLFSAFSPKSVVDIGCGSGVYLNLLADLGVEVMGVDGEDNAVKLLGDKLKVFDLRNKLDLGRKFDAAICIEVIEHIDKEFEQVVISNIASHADVILFSGAKPNQVGENHINCNTKEYWISLFEKEGVYFMEKESVELVKYMQSRDEFLKCPWLVENLMILGRKVGNERID